MCPAQVGAQRAIAIGARRHQHGAKRGLRQLLAPAFHERQLFGAGRSRGRAVCVAKQALHALVGVVEHLAVHPLVVHGQAQRLAHAQVVQRRAARIQHIALKACGQAVFELGLDELTAVEPFAVDAARPVAGRKEPHQVKLARFQRFQLGGVVSVDFDQDAVEIGAATAHRQVACPIGRVAHIGDVFAKLHRANFVGAAANGRVHHHLVKGFALTGFGIDGVAPSPAEHGQTTHGQGQFAVGLFETVAHGALVQHVQPGHVLQNGFEGG